MADVVRQGDIIVGNYCAHCAGSKLYKELCENVRWEIISLRLSKVLLVVVLSYSVR